MPPTDLAARLDASLRETESMNRVWGKPHMHRLRARLIEVVDGWRRDIDAGNTRDCQTAIEDLSNSFIESEESDVPANFVGILTLQSPEHGVVTAMSMARCAQRAEEFRANPSRAGEKIFAIQRSHKPSCGTHRPNCVGA